MKNWIYKLVMLAGILIISGCSIDGTVTDESGNAVVGATVTASFNGEQKSTTTDADGQYVIEDVEDEVSVNVSADGFEPSTQTTTVKESDVTLDFILTSIGTPEVPRGTVSGIIQNSAGTLLEGVRVSSSFAEAFSDASGAYTLEANIGEKVSITASLLNYATNSRNVAVTESTDSSLNLTLVNIDATVVFDVSDGATITTKGATVVLGAASIVNKDGSAFSGNVVAKVSFNQVTSTVGAEAFPGDYVGVETNGDESVIQSYGFIDVTLEDETGNELILADGATATLTYPMDENLDATPATIPLWYYDTVTGSWMEDGVATYDAATNTYSGTVTHFTTWNLDAKVPRAKYSTCVEDANGLRVPIATIYFTAPGYNRVLTNNDVNGEFGFRNAPSGLPISLRAKLGDTISAAREFTLTAGEDRVDSECLKLDLDSKGSFFSVKGKVTYSDGTPISSRYVDMYDQDNNYVGYARTDDNGVFASSTYLRNDIKKITLKFGINLNGSYLNYERTFNIHPVQEVTNVGTIEVKATTVTGCVEKADGTTDFGNGHVNFDSPYGSGWVSGVDSDGTFSFAVTQDYQDKNFYVFVNDSTGGPDTVGGDELNRDGGSDYSNLATHTKMFTINANANSVDLGSCIVLDEVVVMDKAVEAAISSTNPDAYLKVIYDTYLDSEYVDTYGDRTLLGGTDEYYDETTGEWVYTELPKETSGTFNLTHNGVYYLFQTTDNYENEVFDGTISFTLDGTTNTLEIPADSMAYEAWAGYALEVYQGDVKIIELNQEAEGGECSRGC